MKQALQIAIDYMNDRLEDHDCKYQRHPATEAERINILADIETVKEALAKQEGQSNFCPQCEALARKLKAAKQEQGEPVAWLGEGQMKAMTNLEKQAWVQAGRGELVETYNEPLYTTPQQPKQEQGEPHSWYSAQEDEWMTDKTRKDHERLNSYTHKVGGFDLPLYTTPQQRKPLTDEEIGAILEGVNAYGTRLYTFARAIEAKLKEKNT